MLIMLCTLGINRSDDRSIDCKETGNNLGHQLKTLDEVNKTGEELYGMF